MTHRSFSLATAPIHGSSSAPLHDSLEEVPLASPTTDAAVEHASRIVQTAQVDGLAGESSGPGPTGQGQPTPQQPQDSNAPGRWTLPPPPPKPPVFTYVHDDSDTAMSELEEFFS